MFYFANLPDVAWKFLPVHGTLFILSHAHPSEGTIFWTINCLHILKSKSGYQSSRKVTFSNKQTIPFLMTWTMLYGLFHDQLSYLCFHGTKYQVALIHWPKLFQIFLYCYDFIWNTHQITIWGMNGSWSLT